MTKQEAIIVSAYTGFLMCDFNDMHEYIEKKLGRPIWTHEFALDLIQNEIHEKVKPDFLKICKEVNMMNWVEKMRTGMKMMMEACEESTHDEKSLGCEICPFGEICGPIPYDPDGWGKYVQENKE